MTKERLAKRHTESIVTLPITESEAEPLYPSSLPLFQPERYAANRDILSYLAQRTVAETDDPLAGGDVLNDYYPISRIDPVRAANTLARIQAAQPFRLRNTAHPHLSLEQALTQNQDRTLLTAPTHAADGKILSHLAQNGVDLKRVGLLIYDTHFDGLYPMGGETTKSSFLFPFLQEMGSIAFIGIQREVSAYYTKGPYLYLSPQEKAKLGDLSASIFTGDTIQQQTAIEKALRELPIDARTLQRYITHYYGVQPNARVIDFVHREQFYKDEYFQALPAIVESMRKRGVGHLYLSFDADVLDLLGEMITATAYSPFAMMLAFGVAEPLDKTELEKTSLDDAQDTFSRRISARNVLTAPHGGLPTESALRSLQYIKQLCLAADITIGIPYKGNHILGSVTELDGQDVDDNANRFLQQVNAVLRE